MILISEKDARDYYNKLKEFQECLINQSTVIPIQTNVALIIMCGCLMDMFRSMCKKDFQE